MEVDRIYRSLAVHFGRHRVFRDLAITPGVDFVDELVKAESNAAVVLAIIGPNWLTASLGNGSRRLDDPDDYVRREVAAALHRRDEVRTIPVLVRGAVMPQSGELPRPLKALSRLQAVTVGGSTFDQDVESLHLELEKSVSAGPDRSPGSSVGEMRVRGEVAHLTANPAPSRMSMSGDGHRFAAITYLATMNSAYGAGMAGAANVWDLSSQREIVEIQSLAGAYSLAIAPDGGLVAIGTSAPAVELFRLPSGEKVGELVYFPFVRWALATALEVGAVAFSGNGRFLAATCGFRARVWDLDSGRAVTKVGRPKTRRLSDVAIDGSGSVLATANSGNTDVWELPDGRPVKRVPHGRRVTIAGDGRRFATAGPDNQAFVWDLNSADPVASFEHDKEVLDVALSGQGTFILTGSKDRTMSLWNIADGREVVRVGLEWPVKFVAITRDDRRIVAAGKTLRIWEPSRGLLD